MSKKATEIYQDTEDMWEFKDEVSDLAKKVEREMDLPGDISTEILRDRLGICFECSHCDWCITEFDKIVAACNMFEARLSGRERMKRCSSFKKRGEMSLNAMVGMAYLIDIPKDGAGFINK